MMVKDKTLFFLLILFFGLTLVIVKFGYPSFTSDEARIAYRGYTIANFGTDELGRVLPLLFNSLTDYQLPLTSYITALGVLIFGKTDFGVRIPFILFGLGLLTLTYKISQLFSEKRRFWFLSVLVLVFSPALIFLSRVPNDSIVLIFLTTLLFYLLTRHRQNKILITSVVILSMMVSKFAWFIIPPFVYFTLLLYRDKFSKTGVKLSVFCLLLSLVALFIFLQIPQSKRSLLENNLPLFSDVTIRNGVNKLRGQGIETSWSPILEKILFNKLHFLTTGFVHWLSNLQPGIYFGQFDKSGQTGFSQMGAFAKILIIPFGFGLVYLIRKGRGEERLLLAYPFILTFPAIFIYPKYSQNLIFLTLPFVAIVIAFGFMQFKKVISITLILIMFLELMLNLLSIQTEQKNTALYRPSKVKEIAEDIYKLSINHKVIVSDDIVAEDLTPYIQWYSPIKQPTDYSNITYAYKFRQSDLQNIKIIGSEDEYHSCNEKEIYHKNNTKVILSVRDKGRIEKSSLIEITKVYKDSLNREVGYLLKEGLCTI